MPYLGRHRSGERPAVQGREGERVCVRARPGYFFWGGVCLCVAGGKN